ncbi:hypothetical protein HDV00_004843 [Rhizophlyctis rosea]|nr:hypothetical protein HDV00_004843 [Rhizophlyctis rosea]
MPENVLREIFLPLHYKTLLRCEQVCHALKYYIENFVWKAKLLEHFHRDCAPTLLPHESWRDLALTFCSWGGPNWTESVVTPAMLASDAEFVRGVNPSANASRKLTLFGGFDLASKGNMMSGGEWLGGSGHDRYFGNIIQTYKDIDLPTNLARPGTVQIAHSTRSDFVIYKADRTHRAYFILAITDSMTCIPVPVSQPLDIQIIGNILHVKYHPISTQSAKNSCSESVFYDIVQNNTPKLAPPHMPAGALPTLNPSRPPLIVRGTTHTLLQRLHIRSNIVSFNETMTIYEIPKPAETVLVRLSDAKVLSRTPSIRYLDAPKCPYLITRTNLFNLTPSGWMVYDLKDLTCMGLFDPDITREGQPPFTIRHDVDGGKGWDHSFSVTEDGSVLLLGTFFDRRTQCTFRIIHDPRRGMRVAVPVPKESPYVLIMGKEMVRMGTDEDGQIIWRSGDKKWFLKPIVRPSAPGWTGKLGPCDMVQYLTQIRQEGGLVCFL